MENNRAEVYELQRYLRIIQLAYGLRPLINPDGIYGAETIEAVRRFQIANNIPATGRVDTLSWNRIYEEYLVAQEILDVARAIRAYPSGVTELKKGDESDEIYVLQFLLRKNDKRLKRPQTVSLNGVFDNETERAVKELQRVLGKEQTGIVDKRLWNELADYHNVKYLNE